MLRYAMSGKNAGAILLGACLASGCGAYRPVNQPLEQWEMNRGYRPKLTESIRPVGDVLVVLAFSGGGTRAAAFAYGVLQELRDTKIAVDGREERLLDEVDLITSVSGGSFTSAYYALFGDRIFTEFEERFLRRNVQRQLLLELLRPGNWIRMATTFFDRSEIAVRLYDRTIFDRATFADLQAAGGPFVQINAADLAVGNRFTFFQPQFDFICSDLSKLEVARAVAASSAVPGLFNALTLRNYAGTCGFERPPWLDDALADRSTSARRHRYAEIIDTYLDPERKYIHLVDGGVSDNIGLRGPLDNILLAGGIVERFDQIGIGERPAHILVIVVNAEVHPKPRFSYSPSSPGLAAMLNAVSGTQIYSYNFETLELMQSSLHEWARQLPHDARGRGVQTYLAEVAFEGLVAGDDRDFFNEVPTSFTLPNETVDRLIVAGRELLRSSPDFKRFMANVGK